MTLANASAQQHLEKLDELMKQARAAGADACDALMYDAVSLEASCRLGAREDLERAEASDLGLRVFIGQRQAFVSSNDISPESMVQLVERALAMAKAAPEDPYCGLAPQEALCTEFRDLDIFDDKEPTAEELYEIAGTCEQAALDVAGVTNSEGGGAGFGRVTIALATSDGFAGAYSSSSFSIFAAVIAGEGTAMERDYDYVRNRHFEDLKAPQAVGRCAGERAVRRLNPQKVKTQQVPVVFDWRVSASLIGHLAGAINGVAIARGTSFLKDAMGSEVLAKGLNVIDDPHRARGLSSKPFDGEGVANRRQAIVEDGVLQSWFLDSASARQLGLASTGHAARGTGGPPSPSTNNLYLEAGPLSRDELVADIDNGFLITELIGFGVNQVTGDYSRGASGFWIEKGEIAQPVSELTVAGNLKEIFLNLTAADDLEFRQGTNAPSLRVDGLTVAGA